jgi:acetyl esterase
LPFAPRSPARQETRPDPKSQHNPSPAWIGLAECDPLVDEGVAYADRLRMAGVPVDLEIYPGMVHGFIQFGRAVKIAMDCHGDAARRLLDS